ncbi:MAG: hypothetical protein JWQ43_2681 [Glaciihabitans sp.]|nr:hypothetical protein [Glaciihabitans sp.]
MEPSASEPIIQSPFDSDEEALIAATATYSGYSKAGANILIDGGHGAERIDAFVTLEMGEVEREGFTAMVEAHQTYAGFSTFEPLVLQSYDRATENGEDVVTAYVCVDLTGVEAFNESGDSIVDYDQSAFPTFLLRFNVDDSESTILRLAHSELWSGESVCL